MPLDPGMVAYEGYRECAGFRSLISGERIPEWGKAEPRVRECWRAAADAVIMARQLER